MPFTRTRKRSRRQPPTPERLALESEVLALYGVESQRRTADLLGIKPGQVARITQNALKANRLKPMGKDGWQRMHALGRDAMRGDRSARAEQGGSTPAC